MVHLHSDMMPGDEFNPRDSSKETHKTMKKLITIAIGLGLVLGLGSASFAQDKSTSSKKEKSTNSKKGKTSKSDKSTSKM